MRLFQIFLILFLAIRVQGKNISLIQAKEQIKVSVPFENTHKLNPLSKLKWSELNSDFPQCLTLASSLKNKYSQIQNWIFFSVLNCRRGFVPSKNQEFEFQKKSKKMLLDFVRVGLSEKSNTIIFSQRKAILKVWSEVFRELASSELNLNWTITELDLIEDFFDLYASEFTKEDYAWNAYLKYNYYFSKKSFDEAQYFLRLSFRHSNLVKLKNLYLAQIPDIFPPVTYESADQKSELAENEAEIETNLQQAILDKNTIKTIEYRLNYLNKFPGGRFSRSYSDKIFETLIEQDSMETSNQVLDMMLTSPLMQLSEWAQQAHRRGEYVYALAFAEAVLPQLKNSSLGNQLLWAAGRSALFIGAYDKATQYFDQLISLFPNSEEAKEALFRQALLQFRQANYSSAVILFDKVLQKRIDKYEISARYWLIRSLEKSKSDRFEVEKKKLTEKYPYTYFALRLMGDSRGAMISFDQDSKIQKINTDKINLILSKSDEQHWSNFLLLTEHSWLSEALTEVSQINVPQDAAILRHWAEILAKAKQYSSAITLFNKAMELDISLKKMTFQKSFFPLDYLEFVTNSSQEFKINPFIIFSLIRQESAFNHRAQSSSNAMGLMQLIPPTAEEVGKKLRTKLPLPTGMFFPNENIQFGTFYLNQMLMEFNENLPMALAAYNAGPTRLKSWLKLRNDTQNISTADELWIDELPWMETSIYVKSILRNFIIYRALDQQWQAIEPSFWTEMLRKQF